MYKYRDGYHAPKGVAAETAAKELESIRKSEGVLTPSVIVEKSRIKNAPLHPVFEWRNAVAAQKYREEQARRLTRAIVYVKDEDSDRRDLQRRVYVQTVKDENRQYMPVEIVKKDAKMLSYSVNRLRAQLQGLERFILQLTDESALSKKQRRQITMLSKHVTKAASIAAGI